MDSEYDRVARGPDQRYRYVFNYMPEKPRYQNIEYRLQMPSMQEILKLRDAGKLNPNQAAWFESKPAEELYDVDQDPWELHNLAGNPKYQAKLAELRGAFNEWKQNFTDMGNVSEKEMIRKMWKGGTEPPATATPKIVPATAACASTSPPERFDRLPHRPRRRNAASGNAYRAKLERPGKWKNGDKQPAPPTWNVYDGEVIPLKNGDTLHVNAMRIGYKPAVIEYVDGKTVPAAP